MIETPLHLAIMNGQEKIVEKLIRGGSDVNLPNVDEVKPLHRATLKGNKKIVEALLKAGADGIYLFLLNPLFKNNYFINILINFCSPFIQLMPMTEMKTLVYILLLAVIFLH